jgi:hypothetical protein
MKVIKAFASQIKTVNEADRTMRVVISTVNPDRSKDRVFPRGADITDYLTNPVVAEFHDYDEPAIANGVQIEIYDDRIEAVVKFFEPGVYDRSDLFWNLYSTGKQRAWSIGFDPVDYTINELGGYDFKTWKLLEFSAVLIGANAEALSYMKSLGADPDKMLATQKTLDESAEKLEAELPKPNKTPADTTRGEAPVSEGEPKTEDETPKDTSSEGENKGIAIPVVSKDVDQVVCLADIAGYLQYIIRSFGRDEVDANVIAKLIDALTAVMEAIKTESTIGTKSFTISHAEKTADIDPEYQPKPPADKAEGEEADETKTIASKFIIEMAKTAKDLKPAAKAINSFLHAMREISQSAS